MDDPKNPNERPEIYALKQNGGNWQISRRDFLKAAGLGAAVMGIGMNSRFVRPVHAASDLETLCKSSPAHQNTITGLMISADGKYLLSCDKSDQQKCWNFSTHALVQSGKSAVSGESLSGMTVLSGSLTAVKTKGTAIRLLQVPDLKEVSNGTINVVLDGSDGINALDTDTDGTIYAVSDKVILMIPADFPTNHSRQRVLYKNEGGNEKYTGISVLASGRYLLILKQSGYGVFDIQSGTMLDYDSGQAYGAYSVLPGGARALLCDKSSSGYGLFSLADGHTIWKKDLDQNILYAAVTPDGAYGILAGTKKAVLMISMKDGSEIHRITAGDNAQAPIAVSKDGTGFAVASDKSILFISLPDFRIIGCPVDLKEMNDDTKGIEIKGTDPMTGQTVTYTLPCGSPIPEGAVCVCNCVAGDLCSCVGHVVCTCDTVCSCVGNTYTYCSCDTVCTCEGDGHYWYPD